MDKTLTDASSIENCQLPVTPAKPVTSAIKKFFAKVAPIATKSLFILLGHHQATSRSCRALLYNYSVIFRGNSRYICRR